MFFKLLQGGDVEITAAYPGGVIGNTLANLKAAAAGENAEWTALYQNFAETAQKEGFNEAFQSFSQIAKVEKSHEARYQALAKNIEQGKVFKKNASVKWHCINCGYVHESAEAPDKCPVCQHPRAYFEVLAENY